MKLTTLSKAVAGIGLFVSLISVGACQEAGTAAKAELGKAAPDFVLKNVDGKDVKLSEHTDKTVVLEWINYNCPFVKKHYSKSGNMPALQKKYADKGVVWLSISSGPEGKQGNFAPADMKARAEKEKSVAAHILLDRDGKVGKTYGAKTTPHMVVISKGNIVYQGAIDSIKSTKGEDCAKATNYVSAALDAVLAGKEVEKGETRGYGCSVKY